MNLKNYLQKQNIFTGIIAVTLIVLISATFSVKTASADIFSGYDSYGSNWGGYDSYSSYGSDWGGYDSYSSYGSDWVDYSYGSDWGGYDDYYSYGSDWGGYDDYYSYGSDRGGYDDYYSYGSDWGGYDDYYSYGSDWGGYDDYYSYGSDWGGYDDYYSYGSDWGGYDDYYSYTDYYTPTYGGYYEDYYTPTYSSGCYYGSCGGSRGGAFALGLNYSDNDRSSVVKNNIDNSVRIHNDNDTTTTVTNTSIDSHDNNSINNSFNKTVARADNDDDDDNDDLRISCRVSDTRIEEGDSVTYEVRINGGRSPYDIEWDGDISGDDDEERVRYNRSGTYEVSVIVEDRNGDEDEADCPDVRVEDEDEDDDNVIVRTSTNRQSGNLASLDSVFLSQVPYTGPGDVAKVLGVISLVLVWNAMIALWLKGKRTAKIASSKISAFKEQNKSSTKIA